MNISKRLLAVLLMLLFCLNSSAVAFAEDNSIMPLADTSERYQFTAWSKDYGTRTFWFRFQHGCKITQNGNTSMAKDHSIMIYKLPEDYIMPSVVGNGSASFYGVKAYTNAGAVVDSTNITGYYSVLMPVDSIIWYKALSTSSEYLTVPYDGMKYYMQTSVAFFVPDTFTIVNTNYSGTPKTYFY